MIYLKSKEGEAKFILSESGPETVVSFIKKSMKNDALPIEDLILEPEVILFLFLFVVGVVIDIIVVVVVEKKLNY